MSNTITVRLVDQNGAYLHDATANQLADGSYNVPWNGVLVAPPASVAGQIPVWNAAAQSWELVTDNRSGAALYRTDTGDEYPLGSTIMMNGSPAIYSGLGSMPSWLTNEAPPAPGSTWTNGAWVAPAPAPAPSSSTTSGTTSGSTTTTA